MDPFLIIPPVLLFSLGCAGFTALLLLNHCLKIALTKNLLFVFLFLLISTGRVLINLYFVIQEIRLVLPPLTGGLFGVAIITGLYFFLYRTLRCLETPPAAILPPTILVFLIQLTRMAVFLADQIELSNSLYFPSIVFISAYLFYVGVLFRKGVRKSWHPAMQMLIARMGSITLIFAPLSTTGYLLLQLIDQKGKLPSFDFLFLGLWSLVCLQVVLLYLKRLGTIPGKTRVDETFITHYKISPREAEVIELILKGHTNKKIGEELFISYTTARTHVSHIFEKTGVKNRVELVSKISSE